MDSEKLGSSSSDSSSEEQSDRFDPVKEDSDSFTNKRSYGCIFCKRGFTNAQALGGHMNIHRKDRANKAKPKITSSSSSFSSSSSLPSKQIDQSTFINTPYIGPVLVKPQMNYQASALNPHGYFQELSDWFVPRSAKTLNMNQEFWGSDLSLQIGPRNDLGRRGVWNGEGVDLELRLGQDP